MVRRQLTIEGARNALRLCDSYTRLPKMLRLAGRMNLTDARTLLGEVWSSCDNIGRYRDVVEMLLPGQPCRVMMTDEEWAAVNQLGDDVVIYRGADRGVNENGLSWSTERTVAKRFPFLMRYRAARPCLVTATVGRDQITALILSRNEMEIITRHARITSVRLLRAPAC